MRDFIWTDDPVRDAERYQQYLEELEEDEEPRPRWLPRDARLIDDEDFRR